jgi:hypothetical protein
MHIIRTNNNVRAGKPIAKAMTIRRIVSPKVASLPF